MTMQKLPKKRISGARGTLPCAIKKNCGLWINVWVGKLIGLPLRILM
jgi:hypothetical protein